MPVYITSNGKRGNHRMFENLIDIEDQKGFVDLDDASPDDVLTAQVKTQQWLEELGVVPDSELIDASEKKAARDAFTALSLGDDDSDKRDKLVQIKTPQAVRHLVGMLSAYDWEFVEQAKQIRGYAVAQLIEETKNSNASVRLKALALLGKVTEVGLFTEKIEIKKIEMTDADLDSRIKEKLNRFMQVVDVSDVSQASDEPDSDSGIVSDDES